MFRAVDNIKIYRHVVHDILEPQNFTKERRIYKEFDRTQTQSPKKLKRLISADASNTLSLQLLKMQKKKNPPYPLRNQPLQLRTEKPCRTSPRKIRLSQLLNDIRATIRSS